MPFTQFSNLDYDQIKTSIKDYLRANSNFTDFDFEGSNFSVLIDTLAYNTYITAFNSNMIVNESFLDSASLRENVVSLARNIGYVPRSRKAAQAEIRFNVNTTSTNPLLTLEAGLVCVGAASNSSYVFSISENITRPILNGVASFGTSTDPIRVYQGSLLTKQWTVDGSIIQRFILENPNIDTSTLVVYVKGINDTGLGREYFKVDNILNLKKDSEIYLFQEVQDEKYELLFGDGIFGKKLDNGTIITAKYIITDGTSGNGPTVFDFQGTFVDGSNVRVIPSTGVSVTTVAPARNGGEIEDIASIKYFAPRLYSAQYRAVTPRDYESIIHDIYPNTESVSVVGGEELDPPQFGKVFISIKPKNGTYVSDFDKGVIKNKLRDYSITGVGQEILDLQVLYVELDSTVYYNNAQVSNIDDLKTSVINSLYEYSKSVDINKFGGRFKYSKIVQLIDRVDDSITSNITKIIIRRDLPALINQYAQYELCFGNKFHIKPDGFNIKSTGFTIFGSTEILYLTDSPKTNDQGKLDGSNMGILSLITKTTTEASRVVLKSIGTVNYATGEIILNTINITSTVAPNNIVEIQAYPESNDIIGLKDLYISFNVSKSRINMIRDVIASGEDISGVVFNRDYYTSSYSNGQLERK
jgi:hypothetical protein